MKDPTHIKNWRRVTDMVTTSGQPREHELASIRELGVTHVINLGLHTHPEALPDEAASVAALGMTYIHIPVDFAAPNEADFEKFCAVMDGIGDSPVHVHCILNARVTAFMLRYRRDVLGEDDEQACAIMDSVWRPGGIWAAFLGDAEAIDSTHAYAGEDYTIERQVIARLWPVRAIIAWRH